MALNLARHATACAKAGFVADAEKGAKDAIEWITNSVESAPPRPNNRPSIMENWKLEDVIRASIQD